MGVTINYISTIERGMTFPRCEKLVQLLNALGVPADAVFCDVLTSSPDYQTSVLSKAGKSSCCITTAYPAGR